MASHHTLMKASSNFDGGLTLTELGVKSPDVPSNKGLEILLSY